MNVLYTCDNNYVWLMGVSVISLFENNIELSEIHVYLLGENISDNNKKILTQIGKRYYRDITVFDVQKIDVPTALVSDRWPLSAFTRLFAGELLPKEIEKVLYLDCDTIVKGKLKRLDEWNASGSTFWGIKDCISKEYKKNIGMDPNGIYINAGVLLINLEKLRSIPIREKIDAYVSKYSKFISYADQDILNGAFNDTIGVLPPNYNIMTLIATYSYFDICTLRRPTNYYTEEEIINAVSNPAIIHYTTNMRVVRPWYLNSNHPLVMEFQNYLSVSPWKEKKLKAMHFNGWETKLICVIEKLPDPISKYILGIMHSVIKPKLIRLRKG